MEKKAEDADFSTFFVKIVYMLAYVYFFVVPSDAACWKAILISLCSNEFSNIPPKLRSHDAAHTTVRSHFYKKIGFALLYHLLPTIMSKLHSGMNTAHIDKIYSFLVKNIRFTCICAFFVVTLRVFCKAKGKCQKFST